MRLLYLVGKCLGHSVLIHSSMGGRSHIKAMLEIGQTLAERGHAVEYVALDDNLRFARGHANITTVSLGAKGFLSETLDSLETNCKGKLGHDYNIGFFKTAIVWIAESYRHEYEPLHAHVRRTKPDVMICDLFANACQEIAEANAIPLIIGLQALDFLRIFNAPYISKDIRFGPTTIQDLSMKQKIVDTFVFPYLDSRGWKMITDAVNKERLAVGSRATWFPKGAFHYGVALANSFFGFENSQPLPPSVKVIGPILSTKSPPLDNSLRHFLNTHSRTLFVAFGSLLSLQQPEITAILDGVLEAMDQGHIDGLVWGLGRTSLINFPNATHSSHDFLTDARFQFLAWAPQQALLNHPSTILFLSHGGLESTFEAINSGTPILNFPFLADQPRNAAKLQELGIGVYLDPHNIDIAAGIKTLLSRPNLAVDLAKAQALTNSHAKRLQEAANFVEDYVDMAMVCRPSSPYTPGGDVPPCEISHLLPISTKLGFIRANRIDVYLTLAIAMVSFLGGVIVVSRHILNRPATPTSKKHQ